VGDLGFSVVEPHAREFSNRIFNAVVAVGGGKAYGNLGYSHHAVQDLVIIRTLPGMAILAPAEPGEAEECVQWLVVHPGP
jgi:transketolase